MVKQRHLYCLSNRHLSFSQTVRLEGNRVDNISTVLRDLGCGFSRLARLDLRRLDGSEANPGRPAPYFKG